MRNILGRLGERVVDLDKLWNFAIQQAYGFTAVQVLDSAVDASMPAPGVALSLARQFSSHVLARNSVGLFGFGWYTSWQAKLVIQSSGGLVQLVGEAGSARVFTLDTRNGGYFSGPGDSSQLVAVGGGIYQLDDPNGVVTSFRLDGKIDYVQDANGNRVTAGYNGLGQLTTLFHTSGASLTISYNAAGLVYAVSDSANRTQTYGYDPSGAYLQTVTTGDGKVTSYTYQTNGTPAQLHALTSVTRGGTTRYFTYDLLGRLASTWLAANEQLLTFSYGAGGVVNELDALGARGLFFDHRGLLPKIIDPLGNITTSEFGNDLHRSKIVAPNGDSKVFAWCGCGSPTSITDELGERTSFVYDPALRRTTSFTDARGETTRFVYDQRGNLLSTVYPRGPAEWFGNYSVSGLFQAHTNRRGQPISYSYTPAGQVSTQTLADGSLAAFQYDSRGNLTNVLEYPSFGPERDTSYVYSPGTDGDRLRKVTYPNGRWVQFLYDSFGRREQMTDSTGQDISYDYDTASRLWRLRDATNAIVVEYLYNPAGRLQRVNKANGTYTAYSYDAAGQLLHLTNFAQNGSVNSRFDYTYDNRGRRLTMLTIDGAWSYVYDAANQLVRAVFVSGNPAIPEQELNYIYDAVGNRTSMIVNGGATNYIVNELNQYTSLGGTGLQYDADGNLISDGLRSYTYDQFSRLSSTIGPEGVTAYEYDPFGNRTATVQNGQRMEFLLDPSGLVNAICVQDGAGTVLARYIQGLGIVGESSGTSPVRFLDYDALGSTATVTGSDGEVANRYAYRPFGEPILKAETVSNSLRFVGQFGVTDDGNGLNFMRARFYQPLTGRFLSPDPLGLVAGDPNFYRYVSNGPTAATDPSGLDPYDTPGFNIPSKNSYCDIEHGIPIGDPDCPPPPPPPPPGGPTGGGRGGGTGSSGGSGTAGSMDPNELIGPSGYAMANYVLPNLFAYEIVFENESNATAPAQLVQITDPLSPNLDWETFELTEIAFGDQFIPVPFGSQYFQTNVPLSMNGEDFEVAIEAGIDLADGEVFATFDSIDPVTGLPPGVDVGFLPPEDGTGRGIGHISYRVRPKPNMPEGTQITNVALIRFDINPVIATDQADPHDPSRGIDTNKLALVTIDNVPPVSHVLGLPSVETNANFAVCWSGTDVGSGIVAYDIYAQTNGGQWSPWLLGATNTCAVFAGQFGAYYGFYSVAHDGAGNVENAAAVAQATTLVRSDPPPSIVQVSNVFVIVGQSLIITNAAHGVDPPIYFSLDSSAPSGASISTNGVFNWVPSCQQGSATYPIKVWATDSGMPPASNSMTFFATVSDCVQVGLGSTVLQIGQSGCVPVNLISSVGLTNLVFTVNYPANRFTNWSVGSTNASVSAAMVQQLDPTDARFDISAAGSQALQGPTVAAQICFVAITNSSAFVPLGVASIVGQRPDGVSVGNTFGVSGRVVDIGREPLLEASPSTNSQRMLTLYGNAGAAYALGNRTNVAGTNWQVAWRTPMTNLTQTFEPDTSRPQVYYRAWEFFADPPILEARRSAGTNLLLLLYGRSGTNYILEANSNLLNAAGWVPATNLVLTNSFQFINEGNPTNKAMFFRAKRP